MIEKLAWNDTPAWVRTEIEKAGTRKVQLFNDGDCLMIENGRGYYNGQMVAEPGEPVTPKEIPEQTIALRDLPTWAKYKVLLNQPGHVTQILQGGDALTIVCNGNAYFNGQRVINDMSSPSKTHLEVQ